MKINSFECREGCGACCIIPSISSAIPGMPNGKPAGLRCIHLMEDWKCHIFDSPLRPKVCGGFQAEALVCGESRDDAFRNLRWMEDMPDENNG
jgi:uncharacterized protein